MFFRGYRGSLTYVANYYLRLTVHISYVTNFENEACAFVAC